jgi:hypothetical protein
MSPSGVVAEKSHRDQFNANAKRARRRWTTSCRACERIARMENGPNYWRLRDCDSKRALRASSIDNNARNTGFAVLFHRRNKARFQTKLLEKISDRPIDQIVGITSRER